MASSTKIAPSFCGAKVMSSAWTICATGPLIAAWNAGFCRRMPASSVVPERGMPEMKWSFADIGASSRKYLDRKTGRTRGSAAGTPPRKAASVCIGPQSAKNDEISSLPMPKAFRE